MRVPRTFAALLVLLFLAAPVQAEPVTVGCTASDVETPDGATGAEARCAVGSTTADLPQDETVVQGAATVHGALVATGVCPPSGTCLDAGGAYVSSGNGTKREFTGHVTLLR